MRTVKILLSSILGLGMAAAAAAADFEVVPFVGYRGGDGPQILSGIVCIEVVGVDCPDTATTVDDWSYGLAFDVHLNERWSVETLYSHQEPDLETIPPGQVPFHLLAGSPGDAQISFLHVRAIHRWGSGRWVPFVAAGAGPVRVELPNPALTGETRAETTRLSFDVGAGLQVAMTSRLGLRFEARGLWASLPRSVAVEGDDELRQWEASAGVAFQL